YLSRQRLKSTLFPYTTLFRSGSQDQIGIDLRDRHAGGRAVEALDVLLRPKQPDGAVLAAEGLEPLEQRLAVVEHRGGRIERERRDRKSTRLNSSHQINSYAVF